MPYRRETAKRRWTISMMKAYRRFCGWDTLLRLVKAVDYDLRGYCGEVLIHDEFERMQGRALIATVFETGARIGEVIGGHGFEGLRCEDFTVSDDAVNVIFTIEKRWRKTRKVVKYRATDGTKLRWKTEEEAIRSGHPYEPYEGYETEKVIDIRNIVFPRKEPLVPYVLEWLDVVKEGKLFHLSYNKAYRIIRRAGEMIGEDFPPHRLRAERATQLVLEYGFNDFELTDWFAWKSPKIAHDYTTLAPKIIEKMFRRYK